ncbi:MAG: ferredoxin--NADP reductase [Sutterella sp.]|nr:ferredoxin--NADP reductase [Sutterella sp.]
MQSIRLLTKEALTDSLFHLVFTRPDNWHYEAGQFARLGLAQPEGEPLFRAYSMSSAPSESVLSFLIKRVEGGALSPKLTDLRVGEEVLLGGEAQGNLLPSRIPGGNVMYFFATGAGLAPFIALLKDPATLAAWPRFVLGLSARTLHEVQSLSAMATALGVAKLTILPATTREESPLKGRIPELITSGQIETLSDAPLTPENARVMLCGNPDFIKDMRALLKTRGLVSPRFGKPGQLLVESLW